MIESNVTNYRCDRCGQKHSVSDQDTNSYQSMWQWGALWYAQQNGPIYLKTPRLPVSGRETVDLCPECMDELNIWFNKPKTGNF